MSNKMEAKKLLPALTLAVIVSSACLNGQRTLTLMECYEMSVAASPVAAEKKVLPEIAAARDRNLTKNWLPVIDAGGLFIYNSSVADISASLAALPAISDLIAPLPHEQYRLTLDINQVIYDGGATKGARALEKADLKVNMMAVESDLYKLRSQVNSYFFSVLMLDRQAELLRNHHELISERLASMNSAYGNGVILRSDIDVVRSEIIKLSQQLNETAIRRASLLRSLSSLTGSEIDENTTLVLPSPEEELPADINRPELHLLDLGREQLDAGIRLLQSKRLPKAGLFATLGYGNPPGNNFFRDEFAPYYVVGASIKWNIYDWNRTKEEQQVINLRKEMIDGRKRDMTENLGRLLEAKNAEISAIRSMLESDTELIDLRKRITAAAESQFNNGTITATQYMNELTAERQAMINYDIHRITLVMAQTDYLNIAGKDLKQ